MDSSFNENAPSPLNEKDILVSVVVPVYNGERYLPECLRSLQRQTHTNIEVLIVDDGSKDFAKTMEIVSSFRDSRFKLFQKSNGGVSTALNLALENATGELFTWLSHDDIYEINKIERQVRFFINNQSRNIVCYTSYKMIDEFSETINTCTLTNELARSNTSLGPIERGIIYGCTVMMWTDFHKTIGPYDERLRYVQDYDYWTKLHSVGAQFVLIDEPLVSIRTHPEQTGKKSNTYVENYDLWYKIASIWASEIVKTQSEKELLDSIDDYSEFCYQQGLDGALAKLDEFELEILNRKKTSVIIPTYRRLNLIQKTVMSVLNQTIKNLEIIVVIDDKDMHSCERIMKYLEELNDDRIKYLINRGSKSGPSACRNIGLEAAQGDFIAFLDSDDLYLRDKIRIQTREMIIHSADFSHTDYLRFHYRTGKMKLIDTSHHSGLNQLVYFVDIGCGISTSTTMFRSSFLKNYNIQFDEDKRYGEDIFFFIDCVYNSDKPLLHLDTPLTLMRQHLDSAMLNKEAQAIHAKNIGDLKQNRDVKRSAISQKIKEDRSKLHVIVKTERDLSFLKIYRFLQFRLYIVSRSIRLMTFHALKKLLKYQFVLKIHRNSNLTQKIRGFLLK